MGGGSFLRHTAVYGVATFLMQAAGFVLLPLYLRCLTRPEFGVLEVVTRLAETAGTLLLFGGFRQALFAMHNQASDERERRQVVCATYLLLLAGAGIGGAVMLTLSPWLASVLAGDGATLDAAVLRLGVLTILLEPFSLAPLSLLQARTQSLAYVVIVLVQFLTRVALAVALVAWLGLGVWGVLLAVALTGAIFGVALSAIELSRGLVVPTWAQVRSLLAFALPLLPGGLCFFVLHHGDRFFLLRSAGEVEVGIYGLGYKLALLVGTFGLGPAFMVWSARMYAVAKTPDAPLIFGRMFTRILAAYALVGLAVCLFAPEVVAVLGGEGYTTAALLVPPIVLACFFQSASTLMDAGLFITRRTDRKLLATIAATVVMVTLYVFLIPPFGAMGAALATLGGFAFLAAATFCVSQPQFPVRYEWGRLGAVLGVVVVLWAVGQASPSGAEAIPGKALLLVAAVLFYAGLATDKEREWVSSCLFPSPPWERGARGEGVAGSFR